MVIAWDPNKAAANKRDHGISFETARYVFADPNRLERYDRSENNDSEEDRYQTLGMVGRVLFVVYTERAGTYRLISARVADKDERRIYYENGNKRNTDWTKANG